MDFWPKPKNDPAPDPTNAEANKTPEKTPAEMIAEALKPFGETLTQLRTELTAVKDQTKPKEPKTPPAERVTPTSVLEDEDVAFAQRMSPILLRQLELEAKVVKSEIKTEYQAAGYGELWGQFEADINSVIDQSPLVTSDGKQMRGDPQYIRNVVDMIFGREARKSGMKFGGKSKGFFLESAGGGTEANFTPQADGLTDSQRQVFSRMKVSVEDAKKVMGKLKFVNS